MGVPCYENSHTRLHRSQNIHISHLWFLCGQIMDIFGRTRGKMCTQITSFEAPIERVGLEDDVWSALGR